MTDIREDIYEKVPEEAKPGRKRLIIRFSIFGVVAICLVVAVLFFSSRLDSSPTYSGGKALGKSAPNVKLETLDGEIISLGDFKGKRVIVNFFNSWCIPCQEEEPALKEFARQHASDPDFVFIGIVRDDSKENIRQWEKETGAPFEVVFDVDEEAKIAFGTTGQPETYAIDRDGIVRASLLSRASVNSLNKMWDATR